MEISDKQKLILQLLKKEGEMPTTKISVLISINFYQTEVYLEELRNLGLVLKEVKNSGRTYWSLKKLTQSGLVEKAKNFFWSRKGKKIPTYKANGKEI